MTRFILSVADCAAEVSRRATLASPDGGFTCDAPAQPVERVARGNATPATGYTWNSRSTSTSRSLIFVEAP
jgi:hypothetical protein